MFLFIDNYVDTIKESRLQNLENLIDASDDDKLKKKQGLQEIRKILI